MKENDLNLTEVNFKTKNHCELVNLNTTSDDGLIINKNKKENYLNLSSIISIDNFRQRFLGLFVDKSKKNGKDNEDLFIDNQIKSEKIDFEREYRNHVERTISHSYPSFGFMGLNPF